MSLSKYLPRRNVRSPASLKSHGLIGVYGNKALSDGTLVCGCNIDYLEHWIRDSLSVLTVNRIVNTI